MELRPMEICLQSATDIKNVNRFTKMDVYAAVSIKGDPYNSQKQKTHVHKDCGTEPQWDARMKFTIDESALKQNRLQLKIELKSDRTFGDREIGEVVVPIKELFEQIGSDGGSKSNKKVSYSVRTANGKAKGTLRFSFNFGDKYSTPAAPAPPMMKKNADESMMAYPATGYTPAFGVGSSSAAPYYPPPTHNGGKGQPQQPYPYLYPQPNAYPGAAPPPPYYGGYPGAAAPGYGYPGAAPGYGYPGYQQPVYGGYGNMQPPKKSGGMGKLGLGLGAGLLGGFLVGDMISDVGEMAAYDAGYDDGFDAGGFDF